MLSGHMPGNTQDAIPCLSAMSRLSTFEFPLQNPSYFYLMLMENDHWLLWRVCVTNQLAGVLKAGGIGRLGTKSTGPFHQLEYLNRSLDVHTMANEESLEKQPSPLKMALLYFVCSVIIIAILLLFTEILMDATVLHNTMLLISMGVCALIPFTAIIIRSESPSRIVCRVSLLATLILAIVNFYFRAKVSKFYVEWKLTKEDLETIASSTSPNGVVILLNNHDGLTSTQSDVDIANIQAKLQKLVAEPKKVEDMGLEQKDTYTKSELESVKSWSRFNPRIIYSLKTSEKAKDLPDYTILHKKQETPPGKQQN